MVIISKKIQSTLYDLIQQYADFRTKGEYGISAFWYWYFQVRNYLKGMDDIRLKNGFNQKYRMPRWGTVVYTRIFDGKEVVVYADNFVYSKRNLLLWLNHKPFRKNRPYSVCDTCFGYSSVLYDNSQKYSIIGPNGERLVKPVFDDIINFHHSINDYNKIHAIGFMGDRVYSIEMNGNVTLLHISKNDYLKQKHQYDESKQKERKKLLAESYIKSIIYKTIRRVLRESLSEQRRLNKRRRDRIRII